MSGQLVELVRRHYRGEVAFRHVAEISQHHRIQASPGYRAAAAYVAAQLEAAGLEVTVRRYPARPGVRFWSTPSFFEWSCAGATLQLLGSDGAPAESLCDFAAVPISVIQRSIPLAGDFAIVAPVGSGGLNTADYEGLEVAGKLVLTGEAPARVAQLAIRERGAAGIVFDGMRAGGRSELDLPDARQYTSFWWPSLQAPDAAGFVISPRQGRTLRTLLAQEQPVSVRAHIDSRFYEGAFEVVDAYLPGTTAEQEVLLVTHLCHPQPGAHDNGSGSGALIEAAATLARLIESGSLPRPERGIRFLWVPEMTGTYAWLAEHEEQVKAGRWVAGLNLDMVGADQMSTGSVWELVSLPMAGSAFADHLLSWLREGLLKGQRAVETPFSSGSDHYILSDPSVGIPTPMLNQWPDKYYHTSVDTLDKLSVESLALSGSLAAAYAGWLAGAGPAEAHWLGEWMVARWTARIGRLAAQAAEAVRLAPGAAERLGEWRQYRLRSTFEAEGIRSALDSLRRLDPGVGQHIDEWRAEIAVAQDHSACWVETAARIAGVTASPIAAPADGEPAWRQQALSLCPRRTAPGPIDAAMLVQSMGSEHVMALQQLVDETGGALHDTGPLMQYWADGTRTIADIADYVELESGHAVGELALRYFSLLARTGLLELLPARA